MFAERSDWDLPNPYVITLEVQPSDIDAYEHVNNSVYLGWFDRVAWSHSATLGISLQQCIARRRGMAAHRTEIDQSRFRACGAHARTVPARLHLHGVAPYLSERDRDGTD